MTPLNNAHFQKLQEVFSKGPPSQGAVGFDPRSYISEINTICSSNLSLPSGYRKRLTRSNVVSICKTRGIDPLVIYAAVMAWGGRNMHNFRLSLEKPSRTHLIKLIQSLVASTDDAKGDFAFTQKKASKIKGLGISFYTKLLFFCRQKTSKPAYILDQWTAKSVRLLLPDCPIELSSSGLPSPDTLPADYAWFCDSLENLASVLWPKGGGHDGEAVERALFDKPSGKWRAYVKACYPTKAKKARSQKRTVVKASKTNLHELGAKVVAAHQDAVATDLLLPGNEVTLGQSEPVRVNCGSLNGVNWQYAVQQGHVYAQVFVPNSQVARFDALACDLAVNGGGLASRIEGYGDHNSRTRSFKIKVKRQKGWTDTELAQEAVEAMNQLYEAIGERL